MTCTYDIDTLVGDIVQASSDHSSRAKRPSLIAEHPEDIVAVLRSNANAQAADAGAESFGPDGEGVPAWLVSLT